MAEHLLHQTDWRFQSLRRHQSQTELCFVLQELLALFCTQMLWLLQRLSVNEALLLPCNRHLHTLGFVFYIGRLLYFVAVYRY